jgi:hypothetical protein
MGGMPTLVLHRPGYPLEPQTNASAAELLIGDSHFIMQQFDHVNVKLSIDYPSKPLMATISKNSRGFIAKIETDLFQAQNFDDARQIAFRMIAPTLSS